MYLSAMDDIFVLERRKLVCYCKNIREPISKKLFQVICQVLVKVLAEWENNQTVRVYSVQPNRRDASI